MTMLTQLGDMTFDDFFANYWQKKPVLIRAAIADWKNPIFPDELAGLALEDDIESRLVIENDDGKPWQLRAGPFTEEDFDTLPETGWSLLVQSVDQWVPDVTALLDQFRFLPNWRLDDIMVSYAPDGSSVGPHFDYYDVFLIQGFGRRRWKIGQKCDASSARIEGSPLNILQHFEQQEEFVLEPGDMLYVPPQIAHWGVAEGECMTYSVGFRAPSQAELIDDYSAEVCTLLPESLRYQDKNPHASMTPGLIDREVIHELSQIISSQLQNPDHMMQWFGKYMTEPKYDISQGQDPAPTAEAIADAEADLNDSCGALFQAPDSRFAYADQFLFVNGEQYTCSPALASLLANNRQIDKWRSFLDIPLDRKVLVTLFARGSLWQDDPRINEAQDDVSQ